MTFPRIAALCVRTPTGIITNNGDQATEFGVEVDLSQATYIRVFQGFISFRMQGFKPFVVRSDTCVWTGTGPKGDGFSIFHAGASPTSL